MKKPRGWSRILLFGLMVVLVCARCRPGKKLAHDFAQDGILRLLDRLGPENIGATPFADILSRFTSVEDDLSGSLHLIPELSTSRQKVWAATTSRSILGRNEATPPERMRVRLEDQTIPYLNGNQSAQVRWKWVKTDNLIDLRFDENYNKGLQCIVLDLDESFNFEAVLPDAPVEFEIFGRRNWHPLDIVLTVDDTQVAQVNVGRDSTLFRLPYQAAPGSHRIRLQPRLSQRLSEERPNRPRLLISMIRVKTKNDVILFFVPFEQQPGFTNRAIHTEYLTSLDETGQKSPLAELYRIQHDFTLEEHDQRENPENIKKKIVLENLSIDVLLAPPISRYTFEVRIPPACVLEFGTGIFAYRESHEDQQAAFKVAAESQGETRLLYEKRVMLKPELLRDQIDFARIDMSEFSGQDMKLTFITEEAQDPPSGDGPRHPGFGFWANPILYQTDMRKSPNVILISLDTLRADHLGSYGYERPTSPFLDSLAQESALFENTYAQSPWTLPSHMSMLFSLNSASHQVYFNDQKIDGSLPSLATYLRNRGYVTFAFTGGGYVSSIYGFAKGFDWYDEPVGGRKAPLGKDEAERLFEFTSDWLAKNQNKPFFLFLHTFQIHGPYACPEPWNSMFLEEGAAWDQLALRRFLDQNGNDYAFSPEEQANIIGLYDGEIRYTDDKLLKPLVERLKELGIYDDTLIIVTSDHGEEFNDHGGWLHGRTVYDELIRVPLLIKFPQSAFRGQRITAKTRIIDILPTVLDSLQIPYDRDSVEGRSLIEFLTDRETEDRVFISDLAHKNVPEPCPALIATNKNGLKFIIEKSTQGIKAIQTFDLSRDPTEKNDIHIRAQKLREEVVRFLDAYYQERSKLARPQERIRMDKELEEKLKALGYLR
jgi:arylsulfatase A-like enzyme